MFECKCILMYVHFPVYLSIIYVYLYTYIHIYIYVYIQICMYTYIYICMYMYICMYKDTHVNICVCYISVYTHLFFSIALDVVCGVLYIYYC